MRRSTGSDPDWTGRWKCGITRGSSRKASTRASERSWGWLVVKRTRAMPGTAATRRRSSGKAQSPAYEFTFWPMRVTSRTPTPASEAHSATTSGKGRDTSRPRVRGTMQKEQTLSHPFMAVTKAVARPRAASGSARGKTYSSEPIQPVSAKRSRLAARSSISGRRAMLSGPKTKSRYGTRESSRSFSCWATHPPTASTVPRLALCSR